MRHFIQVVGSQDDSKSSPPGLQLRDGERVREMTWYASSDQSNPGVLLDDRPFLSRLILALPLAYQFYLVVSNTKLWSGKRPLVFVRGRTLACRVAAIAGRWGGGDVTMPGEPGLRPLGPTRFLLQSDGSLELRSD